MSQFRVQSADLDWEGEAESHNAAVIRAIETMRPRDLGLLIGVREVAEDGSQGEEAYVLTERILQRMGRWGDL